MAENGQRANIAIKERKQNYEYKLQFSVSFKHKKYKKNVHESRRWQSDRYQQSVIGRMCRRGKFSAESEITSLMDVKNAEKNIKK